MDTIDIHAVEQKLTDITVTPIPMTHSKNRSREIPDSSNKWTYDSKAFNLPPQTQISPVITATPASSNRQSSSSSSAAAVNSAQAQAAAVAAYQNQQQQQQANQAAAAAAVAAYTSIDPLLTSQSFSNSNIPAGISKYAQLLMVLEEMGRDVRPSYSGSRTSAERLKRGIVHARILVRECLMETEKSART